MSLIRKEQIIHAFDIDTQLTFGFKKMSLSFPLMSLLVFKVCLLTGPRFPKVLVKEYYTLLLLMKNFYIVV